MDIIKIDKVVSDLPSTLVNNTIYAVRVGGGFDLYMSDSTGVVAHPLNKNSFTINNITKNQINNITASRKIIKVIVFNPSNGKTYDPQLTLTSDRLSGTFKLPYNITNAEIDIITR